MNKQEKATLSDVRYVKLVPIGSVNPNYPLSDQSKEEQAALLNRCLNDYPKGIIIGKDITVGKYLIGEHDLTRGKNYVTLGFPKKAAMDG